MRPIRSIAALGTVALAATLAAIAVPATADDGDAGEIVYIDVDALSVTLLGDSYSAGNGAGAYYDDPAFFRSANNWAHHYVDWLNEQGVHTTLTNLARSGATTDVVLAAELPDVPSSSDLVMLTIGGNDVEFSSIVQQCFVLGARNAVSCKEEIDDAYADLDAVMANTERIFEGLEAKLSDDAQIVFAAYPLLSLDVDDYILAECAKVRQVGSYAVCDDWLSYDAAQEVRALGKHATQLQAQLAARWNAAHEIQVTYVDTIPSHFAGHEPDPSVLSRNPQRWLNEFLETEGIVGADGTVDSAFSTEKMNFYHPNITGHAEYANAIQAAVGVPETVREIGASSENIDIVFAIDATGSMGGDIAQVRTNVRSIVEQINEKSASPRFALVTYKDHPEAGGDSGDYPARVDLDFSTEVDAFGAALDAIVVGGGGDGPESVYSGVMAGLELEWRPGVRKVLIAVGDAPPKDPEPVTGYTWQSVARLAFEIDPVEVYGIDTWSLANESFTSLVEETGGQVVPAASGGVADAIVDIIATAVAKPFGWVQGPIHAIVDRPVTIDARGSYGIGLELTSFEWDFDGDGTYDETTTTPTVEHTFTETFEGTLGVRVTDSTGSTSVGSTRVSVTIPPVDLAAVCPGIDAEDLTDAERNAQANECIDAGLPTEDAEGVYVLAEVPVDGDPLPGQGPSPSPSPTDTTDPNGTDDTNGTDDADADSSGGGDSGDDSDDSDGTGTARPDPSASGEELVAGVDDLPGTGTTTPTTAVATALVALIAGGLLLARRRRTEL